MTKSLNVKKFLFFDRLSHLTFVQEIYLYGSRARGDHYDRSDLADAIYKRLSGYYNEMNTTFDVLYAKFGKVSSEDSFG